MGRPKNPSGTFSGVPRVIKQKGRVAGFEFMRDFVLDNWDTLKSQANPYSMLKLALESDRHALFAEVAELRKQGKIEQEMVAELSDYLKGNIDSAPDSTGERVNLSFGNTASNSLSETEEEE